MCGWKCGGDLASTNTSQGRHHHSSQAGGRSSSSSSSEQETIRINILRPGQAYPILDLVVITVSTVQSVSQATWFGYYTDLGL